MSADMSPPPLPMPVQEMWEHLLALADTVGAASAEAHQKIADAYAGAHQGGGWQAGGLQSLIAGQADSPDLGSFFAASDFAERFSSGSEGLLEVCERMTDATVDAVLAYADAHTRAALAVAECHEQLTSIGDLEPLKTIGAARAELLRTVATAGTAALREILS